MERNTNDVHNICGNALCPGVRATLWQNMSEEARKGFYRSVGNQLLVGRVDEVEDRPRLPVPDARGI